MSTCSSEPPPTASALATSPTLQAAVDRWTGPLLPEDQYADWAEEHRDRLNETHAAVVTLLGSKLFELGEVEAALALLEPLASARPLDEPLHRVLIDVLASLGRRWEAIETYERLRRGPRRGICGRTGTANQGPLPSIAHQWQTNTLTLNQMQTSGSARTRKLLWGDGRSGSDCGHPGGAQVQVNHICS